MEDCCIGDCIITSIELFIGACFKIKKIVGALFVGAKIVTLPESLVLNDSTIFLFNQIPLVFCKSLCTASTFVSETCDTVILVTVTLTGIESVLAAFCF